MEVALALRSFLNGRPFCWPDVGTEMTFDFPPLIAHAARTRHLSYGTIVGSGTVANRSHREVGSSCIAERVRIEMLDAAGRMIFRAIDQEIRRYTCSVA